MQSCLHKSKSSFVKHNEWQLATRMHLHRQAEVPSELEEQQQHPQTSKEIKTSRGIDYKAAKLRSAAWQLNLSKGARPAEIAVLAAKSGN